MIAKRRAWRAGPVVEPLRATPGRTQRADAPHPTPFTLYCLAVLVVLAGCRRAGTEAPLFTLVPPEQSGVTFVNRIEEKPGLTVLDYEYLYNGGGVAVGDVDGDGLPDLFFTANMGPNALYLNRGGFRFEDVTAHAGVAGGPGWKTGVTMVDVDGDGWLDIYVCKSGDVREAWRRNELYVNNGDGTFTERAADFGLDDPGYSTHATFFDYDRDGDLDAFVVNHPIRRMQRFDVALVRLMRDPLSGDRLYRNDGGRFVDVSEQAGIIANPIGFGLSATAGDLTGDGWPDLYVANDYVEDDYLYVNNGDGTFTERVRDVLSLTSYSSMGADIADVDNDGRLDLLTLDMLPEDDRRRKRLYGPVDVEAYRNMFERGHHHQVMRNMLHLNQGEAGFSEIGQLAGVDATDWSWAGLLADYDNDGFKDLFVTTGYRRDYTDMDFWEYEVPALAAAAQSRGQKPSPMDLVTRMPQTKLRSYFFRNRGDLTFEPRSDAWGIAHPSLSSGAAYADLDDDGDLDLVVSNLDEPPFLYRNDADRLTENRFLKLRLEGDGPNRFGVGATAAVTTPDGRTFLQHLMPARGYQSSVEPVLLFGLGTAAEANVQVTWPDGRRQVVRGVPAGQTLTLRQQDAVRAATETTLSPSPRRFTPLPDRLGLDFVHQEDALDDFAREPLLPRARSRYGPALAHADVNRDGLEDVFFGGAHGQPGALYLQQSDGRFARAPVPDFDAHADFEDVAALFVDVDGDGAPDLYVVSGGAGDDSLRFQDRLYRNTGFGAFAYDPHALPEMPASGGTVAAADIDADGDLDLFVGGRVLPGRYPFPPRSYLLRNDGGRFVDVTDAASPALLRPGLVAAAAWADVDADGRPDLVLAGEWMPVRIFRNVGAGTFTEITAAAGLARSAGWWSALHAADLDGDGDVDLVAGNRGLNGALRAHPDEPVTVHAADFDDNGTIDAVLSRYTRGRSVPLPTRDELLAQLPGLADRFPTYASYADAATADVLSAAQRRRALVLEAHTFATTVFENQGDGTFHARPLPTRAQFAPVNGILASDFDRDGVPDLLLAGNDFGMPPQAGRDAAGRGLLLRGRGGLAFDALPPEDTGFIVPGDVRRLALLNTRNGPIVLAANNDDAPTIFALR